MADRFRGTQSHTASVLARSARIRRNALPSVSVTDQLLGTVASSIEPFGSERMRWIVDAIDLIRGRADAIEWGRLTHSAISLGLRLAVRDRFLQLNALAPGMAPAPVLAELGAAGRQERIEHWFVRHSGVCT